MACQTDSGLVFGQLGSQAPEGCIEQWGTDVGRATVGLHHRVANRCPPMVQTDRPRLLGAGQSPFVR